MERVGFILMAFVGGTFLALQGGLNARLGVLLKSPLLASVVAFVSSAFFAVLIAMVAKVSIPSQENLKLVPNYLWFTGGVFSVLGISLYYITIPKLGVSTMISLGLCGQLIFAVIAGHFGWLNLPVEPITTMRLVGVVCMIVGILFINLN
jgi:transporter family-2 protein